MGPLSPWSAGFFARDHLSYGECKCISITFQGGSERTQNRTCTSLHTGNRTTEEFLDNRTCRHAHAPRKPPCGSLTPVPEKSLNMHERLSPSLCAPGVGRALKPSSSSRATGSGRGSGAGAGEAVFVASDRNPALKVSRELVGSCNLKVREYLTSDVRGLRCWHDVIRIKFLSLYYGSTLRCVGLISGKVFSFCKYQPMQCLASKGGDNSVPVSCAHQ